MAIITLNSTQISTDFNDVAALIADENLSQGRYAVEIDGMLVPKSRLADTAIVDGMKIEVVQAVGGG